jgi:15-cis-phytoene synthase
VDLIAAYAACAAVTRREARNFYYAFLSLPKPQRLAVYALYAFCREADDVVDAEPSRDSLVPRRPEPVGSSPDRRRRAGLDQLRSRLERAVQGKPSCSMDLALADAIHRFGVNPDDLNDVLDGMSLDVTLTRVESQDALDQYCYYAASAVGLATLPVLNAGAPPTDAMREAAIDLGLGMQYINILRDVAEDLDRDRIYLPQDQLAHYGLDEAALRAHTMSAPLRGMLKEHADRGRALLISGRRLLPSLPRRSRACPWLLSEFYLRILDRIVSRDYDVFSGRVTLSKATKLGLLLSTVWRRP